MFSTFCTIAFTLITVLFATLGMDWINIGQGLHPAIAMPVATLSLLSAFGIPLLFSTRTH